MWADTSQTGGDYIDNNTGRIRGNGVLFPERVLVLVAPADPAVGKTGSDPRIRVHDIPPVNDRRVRTPAQPPDLGRHKPPVLLVPGQDHHRIPTREHPLAIP